MHTTMIRLLLALLLAVLTLNTAAAQEPHGLQAFPPSDDAFELDVIASYVGKALPEEYRAELVDVTSTFKFKQPTNVYAGTVLVNMYDSSFSADIIVFRRNNKIAGIELLFVPEHASGYAALPFETQRASYDLVWGHIADNYSGSDLGETLIYDDTGALYEWQDARGSWWTLSWVLDGAVTLAFDKESFRGEHTFDTNRRVNELAGMLPGE